MTDYPHELDDTFNDDTFNYERQIEQSCHKCRLGLRKALEKHISDVESLDAAVEAAFLVANDFAGEFYWAGTRNRLQKMGVKPQKPDN